MINISSSFLSRACCKRCGGRPTFHYQFNRRYLWQNPAHDIFTANWIKKYIKHFNSEWYADGSFRYFKKSQDHSFILYGKAYNPALHKIRGNPTSAMQNMNEFLCCPCGITNWAFNDKSVKNRLEIVNRKGKYKYSKNFR